MESKTRDRTASLAAGGAFGAGLALVAGSTPIGIGIVGALGAGLSWHAWRRGGGWPRR